jgi:hypothetical protein
MADVLPHPFWLSVPVRSVAVELKELQPLTLSRASMQTQNYAASEEEEPAAPSDAGHISFAAMPRPDLRPVIVAPAQTAALAHLLGAGGDEDAAPERCSVSADASSSAAHCRAADSGRGGTARAKEAEDAVSDAPVQGKQASAARELSGRLALSASLPSISSAKGHGSSASLDSMGEPKKRSAGSERDNKRCAVLPNKHWHQQPTTNLFGLEALTRFLV